MVSGWGETRYNLSNDVEGDVSLGVLIVFDMGVGDKAARKDRGGANMLDRYFRNVLWLRGFEQCRMGSWEGKTSCG
jgi:hypothetical protein